MALRIGLIGLGVMGSNHARIVAESKRANLTKVFDANPGASQVAARQYGAESVADIHQMMDCDAVIVASSTASHASIADGFVSSRIPLLIEKPLCFTLDETVTLIEKARSNRVPIQCGFVERFNPAVTTALKMIDGPVRHLSTYRHSPFNPRASSGVVTDLLIHDLDLTTRLAPRAVEPSVGASLWAPNDRAYVETADCTFQYADQMTAIQSASRWGQKKIREIRISTDELLLELDLLRVTATAFRHRSQEVGNEGETLSYRSETMIEVPFVRHAGEPLALQFDHFLNLVLEESDFVEELNSIAAPHYLADQVERVTSSF